eukprot:TRINITY_DN2001_c1_g2_i1.p1 TRINITY_DN2001_c1_g2~~TRINITY_DN2001_c1_g2_i1.p1  ORF type:complete len:602 (-),score=110.03 TRINITY_DN2001_c1_g2_i1:51-1856(-)
MSFAAKNTYGALPSTSRGKPTFLGGDPKGKNFIYASGSNIIIRDIANPLICDVYAEHSHPTTVAKYSPSGFYICSADSVGNVRIWDTVGKEHILKFEMRALAGTINDLAWSDDSKRIVAVGDGKELFGRAFMFDSGTRAGDITGHSKAIQSVDVRHKRKFRVITADVEPNVGWFEAFPVKWTRSIKDHTRFVNCTRFSPNGDLAITVSSDKKGIIYDGETGEKKSELLAEGGHSGSIFSVSWSPDSTQVLTASADKTCKIWDIATGKCVSTFNMGKEVDDQQVGCLWQGEHLLTVSLNGVITYLDSKNPAKHIRVLGGHNKGITALGYHASSKSIYSGSFDAVVTKWNAETGATEGFTGKGHTNQINGLEVSGDNIISCAMDDSIRFTPLAGKAWTGDKVGTDSPALDVQVSESGLAVAVSLKSIVLSKGGKAIQTLPTKYTPASVSISPDGKIVAVGGDDTLHLYSVAADKLSELKNLEGHRAGLTSVRFSPNGKLLASADKTRSIFLWDTSKWEIVEKTWGVFHSASIPALAWSPDSSQLASGSIDSHIIVWNVAKPASRITIKQAHKAGVRVLKWLDATTLASAGEDALLRTWTITSA